MNENNLTKKEEMLFEAAEVAQRGNKEKVNDIEKDEIKTDINKLREKYKVADGKIYEVVTTIQEDDETETKFDWIFRKPKPATYDRYVKTSGVSGTKALQVFVLDNICEEQAHDLREILEEYPAMSISVGEKLLNMLGLSKDTTVKKL